MMGLMPKTDGSADEGAVETLKIEHHDIDSQEDNFPPMKELAQGICAGRNIFHKGLWKAMA